MQKQGVDKYREAEFEETFIELLRNKGYSYVHGAELVREDNEELLIKEDLKNFLQDQYPSLTSSEINQQIASLSLYSSADLYNSNKSFLDCLRDGITVHREKATDKDMLIHLIDFEHIENNEFKIVNQLEIEEHHLRIPDLILYINGLPVVVFEFKSPIREEADCFTAYEQLAHTYRRDIPKLFVYNAFCVISDAVNTKAGSLFAPYEFFYSWRRNKNMPQEAQGIKSLFSMIDGMFDRENLVDIIKNFIYLPDKSNKELKIVCRYPQFYASRKLYENILAHKKPEGDGKGGTYFGTTGCGKSFTMLFLSRLLMKSEAMNSPTIVIITDRTDLDEQLSDEFCNAKSFVGDQSIVSVSSRQDLKDKLQGRKSGGVFLTTIQKFSEDVDILSERENIVCISDEAHRSQINRDQKIKTITRKEKQIDEHGNEIEVEIQEVKKTYGFAKYLYDSLPNASYVGFTGTPIDDTYRIFGPSVDQYNMIESVEDEITVPLIYEGRASKVYLDNIKIQEIEDYYTSCEAEGSNEEQIDASKRATTKMDAIIGNPDRIKAIAKDFVAHYQNRVEEKASILGKALFVCSNRYIAYDLYREIIKLKPEWAEKRAHAENMELSKKEQDKTLPLPLLNMVMTTNNKKDDKKLQKLLGNKEYRKTLDKQFKNEKSNFKIAIVVDMWLTGFDVPSLDTIYIDKPIQKHNLVQTISRVNRKFSGKANGLVVDYIGIKKQMNEAIGIYGGKGSQGGDMEDTTQSLKTFKDSLDLLNAKFHKFDASHYYQGSNIERLNCLNRATEFVQTSKSEEKAYMDICKRMKLAYDICHAEEEISETQRDQFHFYMAVRSILFKLTKGDAPDTAQMNAKVTEMINQAIQAQGVEEVFNFGTQKDGVINIFDKDYLSYIDKIKLPNTKIKLLEKLLKKAIGQVKEVNRMQGIDFTKKLNSIVEKYNERKEQDVLNDEEYPGFLDDLMDLLGDVQQSYQQAEDMGVDYEEKAFYDILLHLTEKYHFKYPDDKLLNLAKKVKEMVDSKSSYTDWYNREDIKADLRFELIILLDENDYPPVDRDEVYNEIFEQAENYKKNQKNVSYTPNNKVSGMVAEPRS
ncbi:MAG: HsdR family type I site-specific deoxyribonuclease [Marinifilaceae bacterium]|jgi:type I restriction enzyme R subunit|nr:HsdR family type I site-specific deoxyribonuclease [Marinifilaceae bacterium]